MSEIFRLAKPRKKGLLHLVFSRFSVIVLLILLQLAMYIFFYGWLITWLPFFSAFLVVFSVIMIIYLFNTGMDFSAKLTWMFLISVFQVPGAIFLLFTRMNVGYRKLERRERTLILQTRTAIPQSQDVLDALKKDGSGMDALARYLNRTGCFPIYNNTEVTYFPIGEDKFAAMIKALEAAEKFIFLEYFIVEEGYMWGKVLELLVAKAAQGVEVRMMYDGMCEMSLLPSNYCRLLEEKGIKAKAFSPIRPVVSSHYNYRDHRKILVIDGETAFTGGVNLADEYINLTERFGHWKDTAIMLKGEAAKSFTLLFLQMWNIDEKKPEFSQWLEGAVSAPKNPSLDGELETALKYAAGRGVDVKLILPGIPDKKAAYALAKSHYKRLIASGVKIYEYTPGFVHAKVFVSDGCKATVGTINLDYRSLYHHFECAAYMYKTACIPEIELDFQQTLSKCREVTPRTIKNEKISYKLLGTLMKFFAPLM